MENSCMLKLKELVFDKILFQRDGFKNESKLELEFGYAHEEPSEHDHVAHLSIKGKKLDEYEFEVSASGYFNVESDDAQTNLILRQNAAAIVFPYIRSQITFLTAQPGIDSVVLPPMNVAKLVEEKSKRNE